MTGSEPGTTKPPRAPIVLPAPRSRLDMRGRLRGAAVGAAAGAVIGFFLAEFGLDDILGHGLWTHELLLSGLLAGALVGALGLDWLLLWADAALLVMYLVIADTPVMFNAAGRWVRSDSIPASADAIVVLSATVNSDGNLSIEGTQRLLTGLELFQRGVAPRLFTTAVEQRFGTWVRSSTIDQERLIRLGGAKPAWTSLTGVFTTRDEAVQSATQLPGDARTVVVVTSPMHTRRACATFETVGFHVICQPSREQEFVTWHPVSPRDRLASFRDYAYERLGMIKYRSQGWVSPTAK